MFRVWKRPGQGSCARRGAKERGVGAGCGKAAAAARPVGPGRAGSPRGSAGGRGGHLAGTAAPAAPGAPGRAVPGDAPELGAVKPEKRGGGSGPGGASSCSSRSSRPAHGSLPRGRRRLRSPIPRRGRLRSRGARPGSLRDEAAAPLTGPPALPACYREAARLLALGFKGALSNP